MIYFIKWNTKTNEISVEDNFKSVGGEINLKSINPKTERLFVATDSFTCDDIVKDIKRDIQIIEQIKSRYLKQLKQLKQKLNKEDNTMKNITIEDLDRAREEYGDAYDEQIKTMDVDYFDIPIIRSYRDFD